MVDARNFRRQLFAELDDCLSREAKSRAGKWLFRGLSQAVIATPVDTGRARGNWHVWFDGECPEYDPRITDRDGSQAIARGAAAIALWAATPGRLSETQMAIGNAAPYAIGLEFGTAHRKAAGMLALARQQLAVTEI